MTTAALPRGFSAPAARLPVPVQEDFWNVFCKPLLKLEEAAELLDDVHRLRVVALCEEGRLHGINIASALDTKREFRVFRYSVQALGESERRQRKLPAWPAVETLLPHTRPNWRIEETAEFLRCSTRHVRDLCLLPDGLRGPTFTERHNRVMRAALIAFLRSREIK